MENKKIKQNLYIQMILNIQISSFGFIQSPIIIKNLWIKKEHKTWALLLSPKKNLLIYEWVLYFSFIQISFVVCIMCYNDFMILINKNPFILYFNKRHSNVNDFPLFGVFVPTAGIAFIFVSFLHFFSFLSKWIGKKFDG